jgi:hypothetical protein
MARTFKVEYDEEGNVEGLEPRSGVTVTQGRLSDKAQTFSNVSRIVGISIQVIKSDPNSVRVHSTDCRTW